MKTYKLTILLSFLFCICQSPTSISPSIYSCEHISNTFNDLTRIKKYQELLNKMWDLGSVGTAMMVMSNDSIWAGSKGFADIPNNVPLAPGNLFRVGSISKTFIVTATLRLCMQHKLSLDDTMADYVDSEVSENVANGKTVTIRELMNHTSKIPDYFTSSLYMGYFNYSYNQLSGKDLIKEIYGKPATEKTGYSNSNSILLGMVVSRIEGVSAYDVIKQQVINPLELNSTFVGTEEPTSLIRAYSDLYGNGKIIDVSDLDRRGVGGADNTEGGIISNPHSSPFSRLILNN